MWHYSDRVKDRFLNPRHAGEMAHPDLEATVGNLACGDALRLMVRLDETGRIADARFQTFGCAGAIASSDALAELIRGKTLDEAAALTSRDVLACLDGLPETKVHCSVLGIDALRQAIADYRRGAAAGGTARRNGARRIEQVIRDEIRPMVEALGSEMNLLGIEGNRVRVSIRGRRDGEQVSAAALRQAVQGALREVVRPDITVEADTDAAPDTDHRHA